MVKPVVLIMILPSHLDSLSMYLPWVNYRLPFDPVIHKNQQLLLLPKTSPLNTLKPLILKTLTLLGRPR